MIELENNRWFSAVCCVYVLANNTQVVLYFESCMAPLNASNKPMKFHDDNQNNTQYVRFAITIHITSFLLFGS